MVGRAARQARVEVALARDGEVNKSGLARELGVSRRTIRRDVAAVRVRWAALEAASGRNLLAERAGTAVMLGVVAQEALAQYTKVAGSAQPHHGAAVGYLRTAMTALEKRAKLLGLDTVQPEEVLDQVVTVRYVDRLGQAWDRPPYEAGRRPFEEVYGAGSGQEAGASGGQSAAGSQQAAAVPGERQPPAEGEPEAQEGDDGGDWAEGGGEAVAGGEGRAVERSTTSWWEAEDEGPENGFWRGPCVWRW